MKKFLLISISLLVIALLIVVAVFFYVSMQLKQSQLPVTSDALSESGPAVVVPDASSSTTTVLPQGVPLRDIPLGDSQRSVLDTMRVDVDTFIITPAVQACAAEKLGSDRMEAIINGEAPTVIETTKLLSCL